MSTTYEQLIEAMEHRMVYKARLLAGCHSAIERSPYASSLLRNYHHYRHAGGTKTLHDILREAD